MPGPTRPPAAASSAPDARPRLVTRSVAVDPADALDRLELDEGSADDHLRSGEWVRLGADRVRLVPLAADDPRRAHAWALVETEHATILAGDGPDPDVLRAA